MKPKKSLGQNFLTSKSIVAHIAKVATLTPKDYVIEIGPGRGILTEELSRQAQKVTAIELDQDLIPALREKFPPPPNSNVEILHENALDFIPPKTATYKIVANIPYYITSPLITHFLTAQNPPRTMTLLVQKEVAYKICAQTPQNPKEHHSILSLQTQLYAKPKISFHVSRGSFTPMPKVDSAVIHLATLEPKTRPRNPAAILALAKQAFSQKRKKLSNTLETIRPKLTRLGFQDKRPEHLSIKDWEKLAHNLQSALKIK